MAHGPSGPFEEDIFAAYFQYKILLLFLYWQSESNQRMFLLLTMSKETTLSELTTALVLFAHSPSHRCQSRAPLLKIENYKNLS